VCLSVVLGNIGQAHAGLDMRHLVLVLSPGLDDVERIEAARRILTQAGQQQPCRSPLAVVCLCGLLIDLTLPIESFPPARGQADSCLTETGAIAAVSAETRPRAQRAARFTSYAGAVLVMLVLLLSRLTPLMPAQAPASSHPRGRVVITDTTAHMRSLATRPR
jgi:hypothetical protein